MRDTELFRRTKHARWSVRTDDEAEDGEVDSIYACHIRCNADKDDRSRRSWFIDDESEDGCQRCYNCEAPVPKYIQALMRLYIGI